MGARWPVLSQVIGHFSLLHRICRSILWWRYFAIAGEMFSRQLFIRKYVVMYQDTGQRETTEAKMAFTLPDLPYSHDALAEFGMSAGDN